MTLQLIRKMELVGGNEKDADMRNLSSGVITKSMVN